MRIKSLLVLLVSLLFAGTATAKICKTVGPDGSITYTDRPGADACGDAEQPKTEAKPTATTMSPVRPDARQAAEPSAGGAPPASPSAAAASVESSVIGILGSEDLVQRSYEFCIGVLPTSAVRYGNAAEGWRDRNAVATGKMRRALMQTFNGAQQKSMTEGVKARNQRQLDPVIAAQKASQIKWCDQTASELESRSLDIKDALLAPLSAF